MPRITGRIELYINAQLMLSKTGSTTISGLGLSGQPNFQLNEVMGDNGIQGYVEEPVVAMMETTITDRDDISLDTLARVRENGTVVVKSANGGKVYTMDGATCTRALSLTSGEGETTVTFKGPSWVESTEAVS